MLICPICHKEIIKNNQTFKCINNHSFDISKNGYINLLVSKTNSGDNKEMVQARFSFLNLNYYEPLALKIKEIALSYPHDIIGDCGCGTGYYSSFLKCEDNEIYGFDISKYAILKASKTYKDNHYFVSSNNNIPLKDNSLDILLTIFAPVFANEVYRIIKANGIFILVTPGIYHLYELKELLYEKPYLNDLKSNELNNFKTIDNYNLKYTINITKEDLLLLLAMTPYYYKTNHESFSHLVNQMSLTIDFIITVYQKV